MSDKFRVVDFGKVGYGEEFLFSLKDRNPFKKLGDRSYISMKQSPEISDLEPGQLVFIRNEPKQVDITYKKRIK